METSSIVIWFTGIYLLLLALFVLFWWQFYEIRKNFWDNRHIEVKESLKPLDFTIRSNSNGVRFKPKFRSDEKLFEIEQNPAKN